MIRTGVLFCASAVVAGAAFADPRFELVPGNMKALSGDGCFVLDDRGLRWQDGVSTPIDSQVSHSGNSFSIEATTPDASVSVVSLHFGGIARLENHQLTALSLPPAVRVGDLSHDGRSLLLVDASAGTALVWKDGVSDPLAPIDAPSPRATATAISADASRVGGASRAEDGQDEAVIWARTAGSLLRLGRLPGGASSEVLALSSDGRVAVGTGGSAAGARAFRWQDGVLLDLGPLADRALAVSADGAVVVGAGPEGAFIWDAQHGTRRLRDVLVREHHLDLGGLSLDEATLISEDGRTIAGSDGFGGPYWRARLRDEGCGAVPPVDLLDLFWEQAFPPDFSRPSSLAVDSQRRVYVSGFDSHNVIRVDGSFAQIPPPDPVEVLDLKDGGPPAVPLVLGAGPGDEIYVSAYERQQLLRIDPDGSVEVVFDGSGLPPVPSVDGPLTTSPLGLAIAADGTLYMATLARLMRIDPDGQAHELVNALDLTRHRWGAGNEEAFSFISRVALLPGAVAITDGWGEVYLLDPAGGISESFDPFDIGVSSLRRISPDRFGGLWLSGLGLGYRHPDGALEMVFEFGAPEEVAGTELGETFGLVVEPRGSLLYTGGSRLVRREEDGSVAALLAPGAPTAFGPLGSIGGTQRADGVLYWVDDGQNRVVRYDLGLAGCDNGVDDDGDGSIDFPADAGCSSAQDDGERAPDFACDDGRDNDGDGATDFPADSACASRAGTSETTACDDGVDNDGDGTMDWNGGFDVQSNETLPADPECGGDPMRVIEHPWYCGLGFEIALLLPLFTAARRWRRRRL